ncbi:TRAP transporter large permease [Sneathiella sp.]|uniref:TRAP transporter large permease n=1 Tax=Sneathiella sp. TaxID=1964365 RepID=UPI002FE23E83
MEIGIPAVMLGYFLISGAPIAFALAICGGIGLLIALGPNAALSVLQTTPYNSTTHYVLATIPMFILMAEFVSESKFSESVFKLLFAVVGRVKGSLAVATVLAGALLGTMSGSSLAATALMARVSVPEMRRFGYSEKLALGSVSMAGTLAVLIPPSIPLVIYGVITSTSIGKLLVAGIIPGVLTATLYCMVCLIWGRRTQAVLHTSGSERVNLASKLKLTWEVSPMVVLMAIILGGLYSGVVTATEVAALGSAGAFIIGILHRRLNVPRIQAALRQTAKTTAMLFIIVVAAMIFGVYLSATQITDALIALANNQQSAGIYIIIFIVVVYLILGCFLDQLAILFLTLPMSFPLVISLGYDPIWFGIIVTKTVEIGLVTPPLGMNVFVAASSAKGKLGDAFGGVLPFLVIEFLLLILFFVFPEIITWLPSKMSQ